MSYSDIDYRTYKSLSEFRGTAVFEFFPGEFPGQIRYWNQGSVYVREEAFLPFQRIMRAVAPRFEWYGSETRLDRRQTARLLRLLDLTAAAVNRSKGAWHLQAIDSRIDVAPESFAIRKAQLTRMVADLAGIADSALRRRVGLWLLGI
jgi:hypothetical protein